MCKYCKHTYVDKKIGERSNNIKNITTIRDGYHVLSLDIYTYRTDDGDTTNELILENLIRLNDGLHTVAQKNISINYCPFCGEKL